MKKLFLSLIFIFTTTFVFAFSSPPPAPVAGNGFFDNFIVIGDSLSEGFQSGAVDETRQNDSYGKRLADLMGTDFVQAMLEFPGFYINLEDMGKGNIKWYQYPLILTGQAGQRTDDYSNQGILNNFGISGADVSTIQDTDGSEGGFYKRVLGKNGAPALDQALLRKPTFITLWIGNNDALGCALHTSMDPLTALNTFQTKFAQIVSRINNTSSVQGVVLANVPNVADIPYLQAANDPDVPAGSLKAFWNSNVSDGDEVLDPTEVATVNQRIAQFNQIIADTAATNGWALFDANQTFQDVKAFGHNLLDNNGNPTGRIITADYLGGLFSLDGVHGTSTGYAAIANFFAKAIDDTYNKNLGFVNEYAASQNDSLYNDPYDPRGNIDSWYGQAIQWVIELFM